MSRPAAPGTPRPEPGAARERAARWSGPILIALTGLVLLHWSWGKWPDVVVDFGRELYLAWRLAEGEVLYRDLAYWNGPLPPYWNAAWFELFGPSVRVLVVANLVVLTLTTWLLYSLLVEAAGRFAAAVAGVVFLVVFAFARIVGVGNYNFVCPYGHELTHGLLASLAAIHFLGRYRRQGRPIHLTASALCLGLAFLTRAEVFLAAALAVGTGVILTAWTRQLDARRGAIVAGCLAAALLPALVAFLALSLAMPPAQALLGTLGTWPAVIEGSAPSLAFFRHGMGIDDPVGNLARMMTWAGWHAAIFAPVAAAAWSARSSRAPARVAAIGVPVLVVAVLGVRFSEIRWFEAARPLPLYLLLLLGILAIRFFRSRDAPTRLELVGPVCLGVFALALMAKMILFARVYHYGFVLAMPAALLVVAALVQWIPQWISRQGGSGWLLRSTMLGILSLAAYAHLVQTRAQYRELTVPVGEGRDAFLADSRGAVVQSALGRIAELVEPDETLACLPEGATLNFLARRVNPTPYVLLMPTDLAIHGEERILRSYRARPPDFLALVHKNTSEFGHRYFGQDYGQAIGHWIESNYRVVGLVGNPPFANRGFGIRLLERTDRAPGPRSRGPDDPG